MPLINWMLKHIGIFFFAKQDDVVNLPSKKEVRDLSEYKKYLIGKRADIDRQIKGRKKTALKKIVLVNPPMKAEQVYGSFSEWANVSPPTGLCYIAAVVRDKGYNVSIIDAEALGLGIDKTVQAILRQKPDIIGIACKTLWVVNAHKLAQALKEKAPDLLIIAGGNHVTALPERSLKEFPAFDILVIGEGEMTFTELINVLNTGGDLEKVAGIAFRDKDKIHITSPRERIRDLDTLPFPAFDLLPDLATRYKPPLNAVEKLPAFSLVTSRGCPSQCAFCDRRVFGNLVTMHSPEYILSMIRELRHKYGIRYLVFDDDNLLLNKKHLIDFLEIFKKSDSWMPFSCQSRVDTIDDERLKHLKEAGCRHILFGVESGSQRMLDAMNKGITTDQIRKAIDLTRKSGIETTGYFIIGYPGETEETLKDTVELIKKCNLDNVSAYLFTPLPGSAAYKDIDKSTYVEDWEKMNSFDNIVFIPHGLTADKLKEYQSRYFNICYMRINQVLHIGRRIKTMTHFKAIVKFFLRLIFDRSA